MPELSELERRHQSTQWQEDVNAAKENMQEKTLDECRELLARATELNVQTLHPDVMFLNDMCRQGDIWEQKANEVMSAEDVHYPQLESLHARVQEFKFPVNKETLAKMDVILAKNREAKMRIINLVSRSHDPDFRQRPMYVEARDIMKTVEDLNGKPHGTAELEKELKRHEDWMRKGKKLFGKANAPLHILEQHMRIVMDKNVACFDLKDTFRMPVEPSSRHASPVEGNDEFGGLGDDEKPIFCICRSPEAGLMIECEICHEWYVI
jgi:histone demethylase JARID1